MKRKSFLLRQATKNVKRYQSRLIIIERIILESIHVHKKQNNNRFCTVLFLINNINKVFDFVSTITTVKTKKKKKTAR